MAASLNRVELIGYIGADPVVRRTSSGHVVANISLCTNYKRGDVDYPEWHRLVFWNDLAERVEKFLRKGMLIYAAGRNQTRKWTDDDGIERWITDIVAGEFQILSAKTSHNDGTSDADAPPAGEGANLASMPAGLDDDSIPF